MKHIASLSYGKDSLAMLEAIHRLGYPLDEIVHVEIWATERSAPTCRRLWSSNAMLTGLSKSAMAWMCAMCVQLTRMVVSGRSRRCSIACLHGEKTRNMTAYAWAGQCCAGAGA